MRLASVSQDRGIGPGRRKGAAVHLAALRSSLRELGAEVAEFDEPADALLLAALRRAHALAPLRLVYERYALGCDTASRFCSEHGLPHVLELNAPLAEEEALYRGRAVPRELLRREAEVLRCASAVLCVSSQVAGYALEHGARAAAVRVRPNAVDARLFRPRAPGDPLRARLVPPGRFAIGFHGRLRPWHGLELLARAGQELLAGGEDAHFVLAGEGPFAEAFEGRVPAERLTILPWQSHEEVARTVACFDALALGSVAGAAYYYSPLKLCEAMAAGVVPVVPRCGDLPDLVCDGLAGLLYEPGDAQALARALRRLARDPDARAQLAQAASEQARARSWRDIASEVLEIAAGCEARA